MPATHLSAKTRDTFATRRTDSSTLRAITGSITFSSKLPAAPPNTTAASLPMTWATTWQTASHSTGLTLPGMIDEPGCRSGRNSSVSPVRGPEPIHRMSLLILFRPAAIVRTAPDSYQAVTCTLCLEVVACLGERQPGLRSDQRDHVRREAGWSVDAGTDGRPAQW